MNDIQLVKLKSKRFFLTVPRVKKPWNEKKIVDIVFHNEAVAGRLLVDKIAIVGESHIPDINGNVFLHYHIYLEYFKRVERKLNHFDYLGKHGKLERVRNLHAVFKYMCKQNKPHANFNIYEEILKKDFHKGCALLYKEGGLDLLKTTLYDSKNSSVVSKKPWKSILSYYNNVKINREELSLRQLPGIRYIDARLIKGVLNEEELRQFNSDPRYKLLVNYLNLITSLGFKQKLRKCCLFLVGDPGIGKSSLIDCLRKFIPIYDFPRDGWHKGYKNNLYPVISWEEFRLNKLDLSNLLLFLEGRKVDLPVKGSKCFKNDRPMIILTSNLSLNKLFNRTKRFSLDIERIALKKRIKEICFNSKQIFLIQKLIISKLDKVYDYK